MEKSQVDMYLMSNSKFFEPHQIPTIRKKLIETDESTFLTLTSFEYLDPLTMLLISIFVGIFGIDRFMLGDTGMGLLKLSTLLLFFSFLLFLLLWIYLPCKREPKKEILKNLMKC